MTDAAALKPSTKKFLGLPAITAGIVMVGLAACGPGTVGVERSDAEAVDVTFSSIQARTAHTDSIFYTRSLAEHLPSQRISLNGRVAVSTGSGIVVGEITDAREAAAYKIADDEAGEELPAGTPVPVGSDDADWRDIDVTMNVTRAWSQEVEEGSTIHLTIPLSDPSKTDEFLQGLTSMGRVIAVLDTGPVNGAYKLVRGGATLGLVNDQGALSFPAMDEQYQAEWVGDSGTISALDSANRSEPRVIQVRGGVRTD